MSKTVLLARPHPFIVQEMKPLLEQCGFSVLKADSFDDIGAKAKRADAALISLALVSSIEASPEEVLANTLRANPGLPVIFAALLPHETAEKSISSLLNKVGISAQVISVPSSGTETAKKESSVLFLNKDDLTNSQTREQAIQLLLRHIG